MAMNGARLTLAANRRTLLLEIELARGGDHLQ